MKSLVQGKRIYSIDTYRYGRDRYLAVTSDKIRCFTAEGERMLQPVAKDGSREEAITHLQKFVTGLTGVSPENQYFLSIRHHDEHACYICADFPKYETYDEWLAHGKDRHGVNYLLGVLPVGFPP